MFNLLNDDNIESYINKVIGLYQEKYNELTARLNHSGNLPTELMKEYQRIANIYDKYTLSETVKKEASDLSELIENETDPDFLALAKEEYTSLLEKFKQINKSLFYLLIPKEKYDDRNVILEMRAGAGGDEAGLFCKELFNSYVRYCSSNKLSIELLDLSANDVGGFKEVSARISGNNAFGLLKYEAGVHRVQRIPITDSAGKIQTSTATVAIMPEVDDIEIKISDKDLKFEAFRASGPGGQSVNTTDSAVRITYLPTGLAVVCRTEKSQHDNRASALALLKAKLFEIKQEQQQKESNSLRKSQVLNANRSDKIRTYNYPQDRITDHRINYTGYNIESFMSGNIGGVIQALIEADLYSKLNLPEKEV